MFIPLKSGVMKTASRTCFTTNFNSQHFEMAMIAFHEARAGVCKPKEERMQVGEIEETLAGPK